MANENTYDVFVTHRAKDERIALRLKTLLDKEGLAVYTQLTSKAAARFADEMREALSESRTLVVVMSELATTSTTIALEVGAAQAWQKAIFVVLHNLTRDQLPSYLAELTSFGSDDLSALVTAIKSASHGLTEDQKSLLSTIYTRIGVPTDALLRRPLQLEKLARAFNKSAQTTLAPEKLLQELIRLRKKGRLGTLKKRKD